jgi:TPP-dependent pyruvate/acetoin dehydrogenase alpha subunit
MTSDNPAEPDKNSLEEFLMENTKATQEELKRAEKEAEETVQRKREERGGPYNSNDG